MGLAGGRLAEAVQELFEHLAPKPGVEPDPEQDEPENLAEEIVRMISWASGLRAVAASDAVLPREVPAPRIGRYVFGSYFE